MTKNTNLCETCKNHVCIVAETWDDDCGSYTYKRNGICYNREYYCRITGQRLYSRVIVKCTHVEPKGKKNK